VLVVVTVDTVAEPLVVALVEVLVVSGMVEVLKLVEETVVV